MPRPKSNTAEYFPHMANHGTTMEILEEKFKNDGYAFWFKLLEILCRTENHFIDLKNTERQEYLQAKTRLDENIIEKILSLLAKLQAIDTELWKNHRIVWSQNLVDNLKIVYINRRRTIPTKPITTCNNPNICGINTCNNSAQPPNLHVIIPIGSKGEESKGKERKVDTARRQKKPPVPVPECIAIYRDVFHYSLNPAAKAEVLACVGENGKLELWREICTGWALHGWNPKNIHGMLECFKVGKIGDKKPQGKSRYDENMAVAERMIKKAQEENNGDSGNGKQGTGDAVHSLPGKKD